MERVDLRSGQRQDGRREGGSRRVPTRARRFRAVSRADCLPACARGGDETPGPCKCRSTMDASP